MMIKFDEYDCAHLLNIPNSSDVGSKIRLLQDCAQMWTSRSLSRLLACSVSKGGLATFLETCETSCFGMPPEEFPQACRGLIVHPSRP